MFNAPPAVLAVVDLLTVMEGYRLSCAGSEDLNKRQIGFVLEASQICQEFTFPGGIIGDDEGGDTKKVFAEDHGSGCVICLEVVMV
jgi:hypothetical protein